MPPHKSDVTPVRKSPPDTLVDGNLHASRIGQNGALFEPRCGPARQRNNILDRDTENNYVGGGNGRPEIGGKSVKGADPAGGA